MCISIDGTTVKISASKFLVAMDGGNNDELQFG